MIGIYKIEKEKVNGFLYKQFIRGIIIVLIIFTVFLLFTFINSGMQTAIIVGLTYFLCMLLGSLLWIYFKDRDKTKFDNFELELQEDKLLRKGIGYNEIDLKYKDIGRVVMTYKYLVVVKRGVGSNINYYTRNRTRIDDPFMVVVPNILSNFQEVRSFIESKIKNSNKNCE